MSYRIDPDEVLVDEIRRIGREQSSRAIADLTDSPDGVVDGIHSCRKRCKKVRGLVRLVRPALGERYTSTNVAFRDAARELSPLRDAHALLATFDDLLAARASQLPPGVASVRDELRRRSQEATERTVRGDDRAGRALELLRHGASHIDGWCLDDDLEIAVQGLEKTYRRGREALDAATASGDDADFHEYRKRTKYSWYHIRLLVELSPTLLEPVAQALHDLSDALGDAHDLSVLSDQLREEPDAFGGDAAVDDVLILIEGQQVDLHDRALRLGRRLHAEAPDAFAARMRAYVDAWRSVGPERAAGEVEALLGDDDDLADLTVSALRNQARDLGIEGRSRMDRGPLLAAVRAARAGSEDR